MAHVLNDDASVKYLIGYDPKFDDWGKGDGIMINAPKSNTIAGCNDCIEVLQTYDF